jgi:hypothetical protein
MRSTFFVSNTAPLPLAALAANACPWGDRRTLSDVAAVDGAAALSAPRAVEVEAGVDDGKPVVLFNVSLIFTAISFSGRSTKLRDLSM